MVHMKLDSKLLVRIEDFQFKYRFRSRTEAARWLMDWALRQKPSPEGHQ